MPLELLRVSHAPRQAVCGNRGFFRMTHGGPDWPLSRWVGLVAHVGEPKCGRGHDETPLASAALLAAPWVASRRVGCSRGRAWSRTDLALVGLCRWLLYDSRPGIWLLCASLHLRNSQQLALRNGKENVARGTGGVPGAMLPTLPWICLPLGCCAVIALLGQCPPKIHATDRNPRPVAPWCGCCQLARWAGAAPTLLHTGALSTYCVPGPGPVPGR